MAKNEQIQADGTVRVDLNAEIVKLADKGNIPLTDLEKEIVQTNRDYLRDLVLQYFAGKDKGYVEGVRDALRKVWPWYVLFGLGLITYPAIKLIVKVVIFLIQLYNA